MKLYIDDLRKCPEGWVLARTVTEAIRILATCDVEEVSIDHDISHRISMDKLGRPFPCGETFEPVAWFLRLLACLPEGHYPEKVTLHTANPIGAKKMAEILADVGIKVTIELGVPVNGLE